MKPDTLFWSDQIRSSKQRVKKFEKLFKEVNERIELELKFQAACKKPIKAEFLKLKK